MAFGGVCWSRYREVAISVTTRLFATLAIVFVAMGMTARADTFTYSFHADAGDYFSVTSPILLTARTDFSNDVSCAVFGYTQCRDVLLDPVDIFDPSKPNGDAGWTAVVPYNSISEGVYIPAVDFLAPGTYQILIDTAPVLYGTFSIVDNPSGVTPEPSSLVLLGTAALGLAQAVGRRCQKA